MITRQAGRHPPYGLGDARGREHRAHAVRSHRRHADTHAGRVEERVCDSRRYGALTGSPDPVDGRSGRGTDTVMTVGESLNRRIG